MHMQGEKECYEGRERYRGVGGRGEGEGDRLTDTQTHR